MTRYGADDNFTDSAALVLAWRQKRVRKATYGSILWVVARVTPDIFDRAVVGVAGRHGLTEAELRALLTRHRILQEDR